MKKRNSNIESLRIFAMLLIVAFHLSGSTVLDLNQPFLNHVTKSVFGSWGIVGVDLFVIISCWFLTSTKEPKLAKIIHIIFQVFTYVLTYSLVYITLYYLGSGSISVTLLNFANNALIGFFQPFFTNYYWFITPYLIMLGLAPLLNRIKKDKVEKLLMIFSFVPIYSQFSVSVICDTFYFLYLYLLIYYLKQKDLTVPLKWSVLLAPIVVISRIALYLFNGRGKLANVASYFLINTFGAVGRNSMIMLVIALGIFFFVLSLKETYSKMINYLSSASLGVYLFHEAQILDLERPIAYLEKVFYNYGLLANDIFYPLRFLAVVVIVWIMGTLIELLRDHLIQRPFMKWFSDHEWKLVKQIENWYQEFWL